jgi:uncharacterized delta-60 repeat protein
MVIQPDGNIVAAGAVSQAGIVDGEGLGFALARYTSAGTLDATFGGGGQVVTPFPGLSNVGAQAMIYQPDGKLVVAGQASDSVGPEFALARYNADGSLDTAFGSGGRVIATFPGAYFNDNGASGLALQQDGKIVAVGNVGDGTGSNAFGVARFNPNGSLDTSFGSGGLAMAAGFFTLEDADARAVAIQANGKIVVAGTAASQFVLARFNPDGTLDSTFGSDGITRPAYGNANAVALQADGKIVEAGDDLSAQFQVARVNTDGSPDATFGSGGAATINFLPTAVFAGANAVQVQPNGKIVAAGGASGSQDYLALARFTATGHKDTSFGTKGGVLTAVPQTIGTVANALQLQTDGKLVVAGVADTPDGGKEFALARYLGDTATIRVAIDIKPGGVPNAINPKSSGRTPVAILSSAHLKTPTQIMTSSLRFGRTGHELSLASCSAPEDVNGDGRPDLVCHFTTKKTGFQRGDTKGLLTGETINGTPIKGSDSVVVVPST